MSACPICERPASAAQCACGYDPSTGDVGEALAVAKLEADETDGRIETMTWVLLAMFPTASILGFLWPLAQILLATEALFGVPALAVSVFAHRRAFDRMQRAEQLRLPAARVVAS